MTADARSRVVAAVGGLAAVEARVVAVVHEHVPGRLDRAGVVLEAVVGPVPVKPDVEIIVVTVPAPVACRVLVRAVHEQPLEGAVRRRHEREALVVVVRERVHRDPGLPVVPRRPLTRVPDLERPVARSIPKVPVDVAHPLAVEQPLPHRLVRRRKPGPTRARRPIRRRDKPQPRREVNARVRPGRHRPADPVPRRPARHPLVHKLLVKHVRTHRTRGRRLYLNPVPRRLTRPRRRNRLVVVRRPSHRLQRVHRLVRLDRRRPTRRTYPRNPQRLHRRLTRQVAHYLPSTTWHPCVSCMARTVTEDSPACECLRGRASACDPRDTQTECSPDTAHTATPAPAPSGQGPPASHAHHPPPAANAAAPLPPPCPPARTPGTRSSASLPPSSQTTPGASPPHTANSASAMAPSPQHTRFFWEFFWESRFAYGAGDRRGCQALRSSRPIGRDRTATLSKCDT